MADDINIKEVIKEYKEETMRHFDVVAEDLRSDIKTVAEGVTVANQRLHSLEQLPERVEAIGDNVEAMKVSMNGVKQDMDVMKQDISFIKNDLKQKVDRDEFAALEKRVGFLEGKLGHQFA